LFFCFEKINFIKVDFCNTYVHFETAHDTLFPYFLMENVTKKRKSDAMFVDMPYGGDNIAYVSRKRRSKKLTLGKPCF